MRKLEVLGLEEITTKRQLNNGTRSFKDPITNNIYSSYESGYVRVHCPHMAPYQLNKTTNKNVSIRNGDWEYTYRKVERIMIPTETERLERLVHCVGNHRKNHKNSLTSNN